MDRASLIQQLQRLAEHPATPPHERDSALRRIAELRVASRPRAPVGKPTPPVARFAGLRAKPKAKPRTIPEGWPFAWTGPRAPVEYEVMRFKDGSMALGWKCPRCGDQVEYLLDGRAVLRLSPPGRPEVLREHLQFITGGTRNQLCRACWELLDQAS